MGHIRACRRPGWRAGWAFSRSFSSLGTGRAAGAAWLDRYTGTGQQPPDALAADAGEGGDAVRGQALAGVQVGGPLGQRRVRDIAGHPVSARLSLSCGQQPAMHFAPTPPVLRDLTGTVGGTSAFDGEPLRRCSPA